MFLELYFPPLKGKPFGSQVHCGGKKNHKKLLESEALTN